MNIFTRADFLVLLALRLPQRVDARAVLDEVMAVIPDVIGKRAQRQIGHARDHGIEEEPIVRYQNDRVRIRVQVLFEPVARLEVEMIRGLVEQQQVRLAEKQLGERDAHLPATRKGLGRTSEIGGLEPQPLQDRGGPELDAVTISQTEAILQIAVSMQHRIVLGLGNGRIAEALLERVHFGLDRQQLVERRRRLVEDCSAGVAEPVLRQVADRERRRLQDRSRVGLVEASHHPKQRRLAGAVRTAQARALTVVDLPGDVVQQHATAERLR